MPKNVKVPTSFAPQFVPPTYTAKEQWYVEPFFTNLDQPVYASLIFSPEVIGALCSRASRAPGDLRRIFLDEYLLPFVDPVREEKDTDETYTAKMKHGEELHAFIQFLHDHPVRDLFSNPRARSFYVRWLAQYGDDSIAQMAGMHVGFGAVSQIAIKHMEDQRIGLAPIEKSTRYVNYGEKQNGQYLYYVDPTLIKLGLERKYRTAMDGLFNTYRVLIPKFITYFQAKFPNEKASVVEKKAFDTLRGLLPVSTLSQVAFFGNGQAFEYLISRSLEHPLGELRWVAQAVLAQVDQVGPSFVRRLKEEDRQDSVRSYGQYLAQRRARMAPAVEKIFGKDAVTTVSKPTVVLSEFDPEGEAKVIAGMLYSAPNNHRTWDECLTAAQTLSPAELSQLFEAYHEGRTARWQKVGRALENSYVRFEITMNIGAWRDLHRHRMLTQQRQNFAPHHGFDVPQDVIDAGFADEFTAAIKRAEDVYGMIAEQDLELAQYAVVLAHRVRFMQYANLRSCFWEMELRTIPEGHPDYRHIEQEKFRLLQGAFPLLTQYMHVNMDEYDFARRGQEERIAAKLKKLETTA